MIMHRCKSGKLISNDSILAFVADNANDPSRYAINNGSLVYNDHNGALRVIDLDLIPALDDTEEFFTPPTVRRRRRRLQPTAMPEHPKDAVDKYGLERFRRGIESIVADCMMNDWGYNQLTYAICVLVSAMIDMLCSYWRNNYGKNNQI